MKDKWLESFMKDLDQSQLQFPSFNSHDRMLVHQIAQELGLVHKSKGEGRDRCVTVSRQRSLEETRELTQEEEAPTIAGPQPDSAGQTSVDLKSLHLEQMKRAQQKREENAKQKKQQNIPLVESSKKPKSAKGE